VAESGELESGSEAPHVLDARDRRVGGEPCHEGPQRRENAMALGAALGRSGVEPERAAVAYLYSTAALLVGAGLRLIALGQLDGQRVLAALRPLMARLAADAAVARVEDMWSFTPGLELAGLRHATLDMRLFRS
jgi:urease accessory protein